MTPHLVPDSEAMLSVRNLMVRFFDRSGASVRAVDGVDLDVRRSCTTALVGESGCGKSQLLHAVLGLTRGNPGVLRGEASLQPVAGRVLPLLIPGPRGGRPRFAGRYSTLKSHVTVVFQGVDSHLHPFHQTGKQFLRRAGLLSGDPISSAGGPDEYVRLRLSPLFPTRSEQDQIAAKFPSQLSGGQRTRVGLCLALATPAPFIVADEPTTGLDPGLRLDIYRTLRREVEESGRTLFLISHDVDLVARVAEDVIVMRDGRVVERTAANGASSLSDPYSRMLFSTLPEIVSSLTGPESPAPEGCGSGTLANPAPLDPQVVLRARGLTRRFGGRSSANGTGAVTAVDNVTLEIRRGEAVGLIGESGSGKSTVARILSGLLPPDKGGVEFHRSTGGDPLSPSHPDYRRYVQLLHQNPDTLLHPRVTIADLCRDSMRLWRGRCRFREVPGFLRFAEIPPGRAGQISGSLSGGERRRIGLARVLSGCPELIIADEMVSGLDRVLQARLFRNIMAICEQGLSLLVISHDIDLVRHMCTRVLVMRTGRIVDECCTSELRTGCRRHHPYTRFLMQAETLDLETPVSEDSQVPAEETGAAGRPPSGADAPRDDGRAGKGAFP